MYCAKTYRSPFSHKVREARLHLGAVARQAEVAREEFSDIEKKHALRVFRALIARGALPEIEGVEKPTKTSSDADIEAWVTKFYRNMAARELAVWLRVGYNACVSYVVKDVTKAEALLWGELEMKKGEDGRRSLSGTGEGDDLEIGREEDFAAAIKVGDRLEVVPVARESASQPPGSSGNGAAQPPGSSGVVGAAGTSTVAPELGPPTVSLVLKRTLRREASDVVQHRKEELLAQSVRPIPLATLDKLRERAEWNEGFGLEKGIDCVVCASSLQEDAAAVARGERSVFDRCLYGSLAQCQHKRGHSSFVHAACLKKQGGCPMMGCGAKYRWRTAEDVVQNVRLDTNYPRGFPQPPRARADEDARASRPSGSAPTDGAGGASGAGRRGECGRLRDVARGDLREPLLQGHMLDEHQHDTADAQPTTRRAVHGGLGLFEEEEEEDGSGPSGSFQSARSFDPEEGGRPSMTSRGRGA